MDIGQLHLSDCLFRFLTECLNTLFVCIEQNTLFNRMSMATLEKIVEIPCRIQHTNTPEHIPFTYPYSIPFHQTVFSGIPSESPYDKQDFFLPFQLPTYRGNSQEINLLTGLNRFYLDDPDEH